MGETAQLTLRSPVPEDAPAISELCNAITSDLYGEDDVDAQAVRGWFSLPDVELRIAERDGEFVAYADVSSEGGERFNVDLRVPLGGDGLAADALLRDAEEWARAHAKPDAVIRAFTPERNGTAVDALTRAGYRVVRHSFTMEIELRDEFAPVEPPEGIAFRTFDPDRDERRVYDCLNDAFAENWGHRPEPIEHWRARTIAGDRFDPELWWLADDGDDLAGFSLNGWHFSGDPRCGWVATLGVRRPWRRRGLGVALLLHSFADFQRRGATRVGLGVDAENPTGAVRLYERVGMRAVRRNDTYEKTL
jgi:ribosomal protein S18 acetylase RimI-like enzyme